LHIGLPRHEECLASIVGDAKASLDRPVEQLSHAARLGQIGVQAVGRARAPRRPRGGRRRIKICRAGTRDRDRAQGDRNDHDHYKSQVGASAEQLWEVASHAVSIASLVAPSEGPPCV
jgi:hypothetical protein